LPSGKGKKLHRGKRGDPKKKEHGEIRGGAPAVWGDVVGPRKAREKKIFAVEKEEEKTFKRVPGNKSQALKKGQRIQPASHGSAALYPE